MKERIQTVIDKSLREAIKIIVDDSSSPFNSEAEFLRIAVNKMATLYAPFLEREYPTEDIDLKLSWEYILDYFNKNYGKVNYTYGIGDKPYARFSTVHLGIHFDNLNILYYLKDMEKRGLLTCLGIESISSTRSDGKKYEGPSAVWRTTALGFDMGRLTGWLKRKW